MQAERGTSLIAAKRNIVLIIFLTAGLDCVSKTVALATLGSEPHQVIGTFLQLHLLHNAGAAFSIATNRTTLLSVFALVVATLIVMRARTFTHSGWSAAAGLVVGGIAGNLIDRIFRAPGAFSGEVIDWIEVQHWPTFNLADSSIVIGAVLAAVLVLRNIPPQIDGRDAGPGAGKYKGECDE